MRVILLGSSQTQHIKAIYESQGWICDQFSTCSNPIYRKILNLRKVMAAVAIYSTGFDRHREYCRCDRPYWNPLFSTPYAKTP